MAPKENGIRLNLLDTRTHRHINAVDFDNSVIGWQTLNGSYGWFSLSSALTFFNGDKPVFLSSPVMAGDVYGTSLLPRVPHYHFLLSKKGSSVHIHRLGSSGPSEMEVRDESKFHAVFEKISYKEYVSVELNALIENAGDFSKPLVCQIEIKGALAFFPVRHINLHPKKGLFQVETGPILFRKNRVLKPAFVFFNKIDKCQLVWSYPGLTGPMEEKKARINFFVEA